MQSRRRNEGSLISAWLDEDYEQGVSYVQVKSQRPPRDSYTHDRPLLCVPFELPETLLADLDEGVKDERWVHLQPTLRPTAH